MKDANPHVEYKLWGPNGRGHGKNWMIGRHANDLATPGDVYKVLVSVNEKGSAKAVTWQRKSGAPSTGWRPFADARILGAWQYGKKPNEYNISQRRSANQGLSFTGPHGSGTVTGLLEPVGAYLEADLSNAGGEKVGRIRLIYLQEKNIMVSNFLSAKRNSEWGKDIIGLRPEQKDKQ